MRTAHFVATCLKRNRGDALILFRQFTRFSRLSRYIHHSLTKVRHCHKAALMHYEYLTGHHFKALNKGI